MTNVTLSRPVVLSMRRGFHPFAINLNWRPYALLAPSLVFLGAFTYWPVAQVFWQSLHHEDRRDSIFVGLGNFAALAQDPAFRHALANNLLYAFGTVIPSLFLALWFAVALQQSTWFNALLRSLIFIPVLVPLVAIASLFLFIFLPSIGLLDHYLAMLGVASINWVGDPDIALASIMGLTIWKNAGYYMLFFLAGLQAIPGEAYEIALIEGASPWQRMRYVTLPYLHNSLAFVFVIALLNVVTQVDHIFVLTKGGPSESTNLLLFYIYQQAVEQYDIGKAAAATVVALAFLLGLSAVSLRRMEQSAEAQS
jgi:sn-glycerol 3-phosphate transport system permease protein